MPDATKNDLLSFLRKKGKARDSDFVKTFEEEGHRGKKLAHSTWVGYRLELLKDGKIVKEIDPETRRPIYRLTDTGRENAEKTDLKERIDRGHPITYPDIPITYPDFPLLLNIGMRGHESRRFIPIDYGPVPFSKEKLAIEGFLYLDEAHEDRIDAVIDHLEKSIASNYVAGFFRELGEAMSRAYGYGRTSKLQFFERRNKAKDLVAGEKLKLDFDAALVLRFDGREISQKIDWENVQKSAEDVDDQQKRLRKALEEDENRRIFIEYTVAGELESFGIENKGEGNPSDLENQFVKYVCKGMFEMLPKPPSEREITEVLEKLKNKGIVEIAKKYTFKVDWEKLEQEREENSKLFDF